jgi:hypothetical protein
MCNGNRHWEVQKMKLGPERLRQLNCDCIGHYDILVRACVGCPMFDMCFEATRSHILVIHSKKKHYAKQVDMQTV